MRSSRLMGPLVHAVFAWIALGLLLGASQVAAQEEIGVRREELTRATDETVPGELIVKFRPNVSPTDRAAAVTAEEAVLLRDLLLPDYALVGVPKGQEEEFVARLKANPQVDLVERNLIRQLTFVPNDTSYAYQWHMPQIQMEQAWDVANGSGVVVAVIDSGVAYENYAGFVQAPDLAGTSFTAGYDFANNDDHPNDDRGHGTHVAGTIAQTTNNSLGVAGVAYGATIMPIKSCNNAGSCPLADEVDGIMWATDHGADVINLSLGGGYASAEETAINYALGHGVVVVAASGNDNASGLHCPACLPGVIAVGATDINRNRAYYSNYGCGRGGHCLDVVAPGGDISLDSNGDGYLDGVLQQTFQDVCAVPPTLPPNDLTKFAYCPLEGTSMASPHVAGAAALLLQVRPNLTRQQVGDLLRSTALDRGAPGYDAEHGYGLIQVRDALNAALPVGGLAELPDVSGSSGANHAAIAGSLAAALALTAGAWYARRRWLG
jgi:serine protease